MGLLRARERKECQNKISVIDKISINYLVDAIILN